MESETGMEHGTETGSIDGLIGSCARSPDHHHHPRLYGPMSSPLTGFKYPNDHKMSLIKGYMCILAGLVNINYRDSALAKVVDQCV